MPTSCGQCLQELCTDSDRFKIDFYAGSTAEEKAKAVSDLASAEVQSVRPRAIAAAGGDGGAASAAMFLGFFVFGTFAVPTRVRARAQSSS